MKFINFLLCAIRIKLCSRSLPTQTKSASAPQTKVEFGGTFLFSMNLVEIFFSSLKLFISSLNWVALSVPRCGLPRLNPGRRPAPTFELIFPARGPLLLQDPLLLLIFASQDALEEMFLNDWLTEWPFAYFTDVTLVRGDTSRTFFLFYIHMFLCLCPSSEIECFQTL